MEITVRVNGEDTRLMACSIDELVSKMELTRGSLVVEHNSKIIKQADWGSVQLKDGDVLELLNFVGGG